MLTHSKLLYLATAAASFLAISGPTLWRRAERSVVARGLLQQGQVLGNRQPAAKRIVEFADYQCPACAIADSVTAPILATAGGPAVVFHHLPLEGEHPFAFEAAVVAECAGEQGSFERIHHLMFRRQKSLGQVSWVQFARDAGVADTVRFLRCVDGEDAAARVAADIESARKLRLTATPAFIIDGQIHYGVLTDSVLRRLSGL